MDDSEAASDALSLSIKNFRQGAGENDLLIVYYAGHGILKEDRRCYWGA